jgi:8-oxo-dGTP pyrophosphatase MutT (NUDIX family)
MTKPKFNNTENPCFTSKETGKKFWHSRSMAVCIRFRIKTKEGVFKHLVTKRGDGVSNTGKFCFPCGYLDFSETLLQAAQRELFEEAGIFIDDPSNLKLYEVMDTPKRDELQNVTFHYDVLVSDKGGVLLDTYSQFVEQHIKAHQSEGEVTKAMFVESPDGLDMAFNHQDRFKTTQ